MVTTQLTFRPGEKPGNGRWILAEELGWPWKLSKTRPFAHRFKYIGFIWDLISKTIEIPADKKLRYIEKLEPWVGTPSRDGMCIFVRGSTKSSAKPRSMVCTTLTGPITKFERVTSRKTRPLATQAKNLVVWCRSNGREAGWRIAPPFQHDEVGGNCNKKGQKECEVFQHVKVRRKVGLGTVDFIAHTRDYHRPYRQ